MKVSSRIVVSVAAAILGLACSNAVDGELREPTEPVVKDGGTTSSSSGGGGGGDGGGEADGTPCSFTKSVCNPDCQMSCESINCVDICCPDQTVHGVRRDGQCVPEDEPAPVPSSSSSSGSPMPPPSSCSLDYTYDEGGACDACMASQCCDEDDACADEPTCMKVLSCLEACTTDACRASCMDTYPYGAMRLHALATCLTSRCESECQ